MGQILEGVVVGQVMVEVGTIKGPTRRHRMAPGVNDDSIGKEQASDSERPEIHRQLVGHKRAVEITVKTPVDVEGAKAPQKRVELVRHSMQVVHGHESFQERGTYWQMGYLAPGRHRGMAGNDVFNQGRPGTRHSDNEHWTKGGYWWARRVRECSRKAPYDFGCT